VQLPPARAPQQLLVRVQLRRQQPHFLLALHQRDLHAAQKIVRLRGLHISFLVILRQQSTIAGQFTAPAHATSCA